MLISILITDINELRSKQIYLDRDGRGYSSNDEVKSEISDIFNSAAPKDVIIALTEGKSWQWGGIT